MTQRIAIVGPVAAGKSTLAAALSAHTLLPHHDLDALYWGPSWTPLPENTFLAGVRDTLTAARWIIDGNYGGAVADLMLARADLVIWLDLPLRTCLPRLVRRSIQRAATGQELFAGNRETLAHLLARDSILRWGPAHHYRHRRNWAALLSAADTPVVRVTRPARLNSQMKALGLLPAPEKTPACLT